MIELDANGEIVLASFPSFALSDGDKATLRADRAPDGTLKVTMRGELFDGRGFIKSATSSRPADKAKPQSRDFDLDVKLGTVTGYNVEALRGVELRLSRRNGHVRTFGMLAKLGSNASLMGDLRAYPGGRQVIYLESNDAGALLRFTDTYSRVVGGQMWIAMDPPTTDQAPQEGVLNVRDFSIRGESTLERIAANNGDPNRARRPQSFGAGVTFSRMRAEFTRSPGKLAVRDGVVWGPAMGATIEGQFDYARDDVRMRGTFVPAYALNNLLGARADRRPVHGRAERRRVRHDLRGGRADRQRDLARQSDVDDGAGLPAQDLRVPQRRRPQRGAAAVLADAVVVSSGPRAARGRILPQPELVAKFVVMDPGLTPALFSCSVPRDDGSTPASATRASCGRARA